MTEPLTDLPDGWVHTTLSAITELITKGTTPTSYGFSYQSNGIRFIKTEISLNRA